MTHGHGIVHFRRLPAFVIALAWQFGLQRFVITSIETDLPCDPECTPDEAVIRS